VEPQIAAHVSLTVGGPTSGAQGTAGSGVLYIDMEDLPARVSTFLILDGSYRLAAIPSLILSSLVVAKQENVNHEEVIGSVHIVSTFYNSQGSNLGNLPVAWMSIQLQHTRAFHTGDWTDVDMGACSSQFHISQCHPRWLSSCA
jgi:hypothetical protein